LDHDALGGIGLNRGSKQLIEFINEPAKVTERRVNRLGLGHVDTCIAQQFEREFRAAALQEAEVIAQFALAAVNDALRNRYRRL
jgi:hypothetical protein